MNSHGWLFLALPDQRATSRMSASAWSGTGSGRVVHDDIGSWPLHFARCWMIRSGQSMLEVARSPADGRSPNGWKARASEVIVPVYRATISPIDGPRARQRAAHERRAAGR